MDYVLVNPSLFDYFSIFEVCEPNILSDHCAVQFSLKIKASMQSDNNRNANFNSHFYKKYMYEWKDDKAG